MLSRSRLTLAAFALLATSGVMVAAGAGPDQNKRNDAREGADSKLNIRIDIGDDHDHRDHGGNWERGRGPHPRPVYRVEPVIVRPVVIQPVYAELAPRTLDLQAYQSGDTVIVLARGENTTAGFTTSLERERDGRSDGSTRITLHNVGPVRQAFRAEVCTPFSVTGGFETRERLSEIKICIGGEERCIPVQRIDQMQRN